MQLSKNENGDEFIESNKMENIRTKINVLEMEIGDEENTINVLESNLAKVKPNFYRACCFF